MKDVIINIEIIEDKGPTFERSFFQWMNNNDIAWKAHTNLSWVFIPKESVDLVIEKYPEAYAQW